MMMSSRFNISHNDQPLLYAFDVFIFPFLPIPYSQVKHIETTAAIPSWWRYSHMPVEVLISGVGDAAFGKQNIACQIRVEKESSG